MTSDVEDILTRVRELARSRDQLAGWIGNHTDCVEQLKKRVAELEAQAQLDSAQISNSLECIADLESGNVRLRQWQRDAVKLLGLTTLGGPGSYCNVEKARLLSEVEGNE